ncbi:hypothetical protein [Sanyastnella coralliicola]|uniref:hypothetical protein n=1 Tax=Sanyastnella coralliicola TaxID=3069118 RepID=UPI0027BAE447|nr:hypothetical protein [Longitalea sp. SCSIO 12813]
MKQILFLTLGILLTSFISGIGIDFEIKGQAESKKYGYSEKKPIMVGGGSSAGHHFQFLEHLRGPNGEKLVTSRIGSCGDYDNPDSTLTNFKKGVLTCFSIDCPSFKKPRILYFDKYRNGDLYVPKDLKWEE